MREVTLQDLVEYGQHPEQWTVWYLGGYKTRFFIVSPHHPALKVKGGWADGMAYDFGDPIPPSMKELPVKEARVFFSRSMSADRFMHVAFHEVYHNVTEWTGHRHHELSVMKLKVAKELEEEEEE